MLNKYGHFVNYKALKDLDIEVTTSIVSEDVGKNVLIPKNIVQYPWLFLHGSMDNNGFNEETYTAKILPMSQQW